MIEINVDVVPLLPFKGIIKEECIAMGTVDAGILIHYMDRNKAVIVEWEDIVELGMNDMLHVITDAKVISSPTKE